MSKGQPAAGQGWGTVKGQIVYAGAQIPQQEVVEAAKTHQDKDVCLKDGPVVKEKWVVNPKNKGVRWAFVWLEPDPAMPGAKLAIHPALLQPKKKEVEIDQPCCTFIPHAAGMRQGQVLVAKNSASVPHNVNWHGSPRKNPGNNVIVAAGKDHKIDNLKADRFPVSVTCNIHPWMQAWVRVFDHPYFAVTDENGNFEIKDAPAGKVRMVVWHEAVGWLGGAAGRNGQPVTVKADGVTDVGKLQLKESD